MGEGGEGQGQVSEGGAQISSYVPIRTSVDKNIEWLRAEKWRNDSFKVLAAAIQGPGANPFPLLFPCGAVSLLVGNKLCDAARKGIHIATP